MTTFDPDTVEQDVEVLKRIQLDGSVVLSSASSAKWQAILVHWSCLLMGHISGVP